MRAGTCARLRLEMAGSLDLLLMQGVNLPGWLWGEVCCTAEYLAMDDDPTWWIRLDARNVLSLMAQTGACSSMLVRNPLGENVHLPV